MNCRIQFLCKTFTVIILFFFHTSISKAQNTKVELINADILIGDESTDKNLRRLIGNVQFRHDGTDMYCDSAYFYAEDNSLDAFGIVRMLRGDTISLNSRRMNYKGNQKIARVWEDVVLKDKKMTLKTQELIYDTEQQQAWYETPAVITQSDNILKSNRGIYQGKESMLYFKENVTLDNPSYTLEADTLLYHIRKETAYFQGPTYIQATDKEQSTMYCERGWYNTNNGKSVFRKNAWLQSGVQKLEGDSLLYDRFAQAGESFGNVLVSDTVQKISIAGDYAYYNKNLRKSSVFGDIILSQKIDDDTLFMHADTLFALFDSTGRASDYFAYPNARFYKKDIQGKCDSIAYNSADSSMKMFGEPVLWNNNYQLTSNYIQLFMENNKLKSMLMDQAAFIVGEVDSGYYNQIKGKKMLGFFDNNQLRQIHVDGNGQSIYYGTNSKKDYIGLNKAECSNMIIDVDDNKINRINMIQTPDAVFKPMNSINDELKFLKGFVWLDYKRPLNKEDIFNWR